MKEPDTAHFYQVRITFCFQLGNTPSCCLFSFGSLYWIYDLYLSYITRLGWRCSDCQTERICYHKAYVDSPAHRLLGGRYGWRRDNEVEAVKPQWPGGEDRVGVEPARCSSNEGFLFCPPVLFPLRRRRWFCQEVFYGKFDGYSKYVCCITAPCVRIKIA